MVGVSLGLTAEEIALNFREDLTSTGLFLKGGVMLIGSSVVKEECTGSPIKF
jgi:hypothetical protein